MAETETSKGAPAQPPPKPQERPLTLTELASKQPYKHARIGVQQTKVRKVRSA